MKRILAALLAAAMLASMAVVGFAADPPTWETIPATTPTYDSTWGRFFANGTPITIQQNPDGAGVLVT